MKRNILTLVLVLFSIAVTNSSIYSTCPPNWYPKPITFLVGNCKYQVYYCYKCGVTGADPSNIKIIKYGKESGDCDDSQITMEMVIQTMLEKIRQNFYEDCTIPPCNEPERLMFVVEYPLCHRYFNHAWIDDKGNKRHFTWWESCNGDEFYCQRVRFCCFSNEEGKFVCSQQEIIEPQGNQFSCVTGPPILPPPGLTWDEDWETDCIYDTSCE